MSAWVVSATVPLSPDAAGERRAHYVITCPNGSAPSLSIYGDRLTRAEMDDLVGRIEGVWMTLRIPCTCGRPYFEHDAQSPHGAGECRTFTASTPIHGESS